MTAPTDVDFTLRGPFTAYPNGGGRVLVTMPGMEYGMDLADAEKLAAYLLAACDVERHSVALTDYIEAQFGVQS